MSANIHLTVRLFGAFRSVYSQPVTLSVPAGASVNVIKDALGAELARLNPSFHDTDLLARSALATNSAVLQPDACLNTDAHLAILPPVCGG